MKKVLIVTDVHPFLITDLEDFGFEVHYSPKIKKEAAMEILSGFQGLVVRTQFPIDESFLSQGNQLEFIGRAGAGMDNIDLDYAHRRNIVCLNAPEGNRDAVAEHTIGLILGLANKLNKADEEVKRGIWDREGNRGFEIGGKTIGIVGMGNTGSQLARKLSGFGCHLIGYDKFRDDFGSLAKVVDLETLFREADIVSFHIPLTEDSRKMVNQDFLSRFKKSILLINTSRGEILETQSLLTALQEGKVIGAGLDVLEQEKFPGTGNLDWFKQLINLNQVILTPHIAGWTVESYLKISQVLAQKIREFYTQ